MVKNKKATRNNARPNKRTRANNAKKKRMTKVKAKMQNRTPAVSNNTRQTAKPDAAKLKEKENGTRKRTNVSIPQSDEAKAAIEMLLKNERAVEYLKKNVSKMAVDVVDMLSTPKTDEFLAEQLGVKINAIRRILNIMQGYGITNYYISKNTKGWLSFAWYINTSKLAPFLDYINEMEKEKSVVSEKCNDYFICENCYKTDRFLFTFDSAFENSFKCNGCGKNLNRMDKMEVEALMSNTK